MMTLSLQPFFQNINMLSTEEFKQRIRWGDIGVRAMFQNLASDPVLSQFARKYSYLLGTIFVDDPSEQNPAFAHQLCRKALAGDVKLDDLKLLAANSAQSQDTIGKPLAYFTETNQMTKVVRHYVLYMLRTEFDGAVRTLEEEIHVAKTRMVFMSVLIGNHCHFGATICYERLAPSHISELSSKVFRSARIVDVVTYPASVAVTEQINFACPSEGFENWWPRDLPFSYVVDFYRSCSADDFCNELNRLVEYGSIGRKRQMLFQLLEEQWNAQEQQQKQESATAPAAAAAVQSSNSTSAVNVLTQLSTEFKKQIAENAVTSTNASSETHQHQQATNSNK